MPEGTDNGAPPDTPPPPPPPPPAASDDAPLGDKGEKALEAWKTRAKAAEAKAKEADTLRAELEEFRAAQMTEQEKAVAAARKEGETAATAKANARLIRAEVTAAAAGLAADPSDVVAILAEQGALADLKVDGDGNVDRKAIDAKIGDLLKSKPHLAAVRDPEFGNRTPANGNRSEGEQMNDWLRAAARR